MQQRLQSCINSLLIEKLDKLNIFPETAHFPIPVTVLISSFRPFKSDDVTYTRGVEDDFANLPQYYTDYVLAVPQQLTPIGHKRVLQVFNPWIEGGLTLFNAVSMQRDARALIPSLGALQRSER